MEKQLQAEGIDLLLNRKLQFPPGSPRGKFCNLFQRILKINILFSRAARFHYRQSIRSGDILITAHCQTN